ncbi:MAG TPA: arsinothricin resistance N-acetyltransferase ArsN1 family B [Thermoanaerobaculia bacterium]|nr:arsinothricin resistance N-acetyltransferase ArsN1 family B [Thermoanaerobaculia bacterium]
MNHNETILRAATLSDAPAIAAIYNHYIRETIVTFEEKPVSGADFKRRIDEVFAASFPWLVAADGAGIAGYAYATPWKPRSGYRYSAEVTVYLAPDRGRRGVGTLLYSELFRLLEERGTHAVMGGIALPNQASIALHEKFGMRKVAHFEAVGFKFGRWIDVGYWQRILPGKRT